jgi:hypothetical protein
MLSPIDAKFKQELLKKEYWDITFDRVANKIKNDAFNLEELYCLKETDRYKELVDQLVEGTYKWSVPEKLLLSKSHTKKKRTVYMYSPLDRYLLGVVYRATSQLFEDKIAENCFSYKRKTTTCDAIYYIKKYKLGRGLYGVKLDISAYFNSVKREHLIKCLDEVYGIDTGIRRSMDGLFLNDTVTFKGKELEEYKALIPGCALGSFFANYCLRDVDAYFVERGLVYARYSDDIILFDETPELVTKHLDFIKEKITEYGLKINESKYEYFEPSQDIDYLGLTLGDRGVDISDHAKRKLKKTIKRWVKAGRKEIEMNNRSFESIAKGIVSRLNWKIYKTFILDANSFGWAFYAFRYITLTDSLTEIDFYLRDRLRYLKTGKNTKGNVFALTDEDFMNLGVLSLYDMYKLFKEDFDYYCEVVSLI